MQSDRHFRRGETWTYGPHRHLFGTFGSISPGQSGDTGYTGVRRRPRGADRRVHHHAVDQWFPQESLTRFHARSWAEDPTRTTFSRLTAG